MRALLTGGRGFVGARLAATLQARHPDWIIEATDRTPTPDGAAILDVTNASAVEAWIRERRPDIVVHLAAVAAVTSAVRDPRTAWRVNLDGTLNLVLALQSSAPDAQLMLVSSAEVYGRSLDAGAVDESALLRPVNPYAASKAAADMLVRAAGEAGLSVSVMRAFNHTGPGQSELFVAPGFAAQIARIEAGLQPPEIVVGNLDEERDFLDAEDVVDAYADVLDSRARLAPAAVFNVASGEALRIGDLLELLRGLARAPFTVRCDPSRLRANPTLRVVGDASQLRTVTGWRPHRSLRTTLARIFDYERRRVKA